VCTQQAYGAWYNLSFTPAQLFGDTTTSVKVCVTDSATGAPQPNVTFTAGVYFYGGFNPSVQHGATIAGQAATDSFANVPGQTDSTGCLTISNIVTWGMPPTREYTSSTAYAYLVTSPSVGVLTNTQVSIAVRDYTYSLSYPGAPAAISSNGTYSVVVTASAAGSTNLSGNYIRGSCTTQTAPTLGPTPQDIKIGTSNKATFSLNVGSTLISDPNGTATPHGSCIYSIWVNGSGGSSLQVNGTNTCLLGLSPGDPNCGPSS